MRRKESKPLTRNIYIYILDAIVVSNKETESVSRQEIEEGEQTKGNRYLGKKR